MSQFISIYRDAGTSSLKGFEVDPNGRIVRPNTKPSLGTEIGEEAQVKKHPFEQELLQRSF